VLSDESIFFFREAVNPQVQLLVDDGRSVLAGGGVDTILCAPVYEEAHGSHQSGGVFQ
jgi:hypothetical protein